MDYSNTKYGKLQILERIKIKNDNHITYKAICECGNIVYIRATDIRNNKRKPLFCRILKQKRGRAPIETLPLLFNS